MSDTPRIAVVIPLFIRSEWQGALANASLEMHALTLAHIAEQARIYVVQPSRAGTKMAMGGRWPEILVLQSDAGSYVREWNEAADLACRDFSPDFLVHSGADIFPRPGWVEAMLDCFSIADCGAATVAVAEAGAWVGAHPPSPGVIEGHYGPFMMFRPEWRFDPAFTGKRSDDDLIVRMYQGRLRSYRNNIGLAYHIGGAFWDAATPGENAQNDEGNAEFMRRYARSPLEVVTKMLTGGVRYGQEHLR